MLVCEWFGILWSEIMPRVLFAAMAVLVFAPALSSADAPKGVDVSTAAKPVAINPQGTVLIDKPGKRLLLKSEVCLREGVLEMLVCLKRTKEHEAILSVDTQAAVVHAGLLALEAEPGQPVQFQPEFRAPTGQPIDIFLSWTDEQQKPQRVKAQTWVRNATRRYWIEKLNSPPANFKLPDDSNLRWDDKRKELLWYGPMSDKERDELLKLNGDAGFQKAVKAFHLQTQVKVLDSGWVFAGSGFYTDSKTGEKFYQAEEGNLICVANFPSATLDLAVPSTAANDDLLYEAYTERIPPVGTAVTIELVPVFKKPGDTPKK
jgi:hypothetical protein